jgi:hypothetical protein
MLLLLLVGSPCCAAASWLLVRLAVNKPAAAEHGSQQSNAAEKTLCTMRQNLSAYHW